MPAGQEIRIALELQVGLSQLGAETVLESQRDGGLPAFIHVLQEEQVAG